MNISESDDKYTEISMNGSGKLGKIADKMKVGLLKAVKSDGRPSVGSDSGLSEDKAPKTCVLYLSTANADILKNKMREELNKRLKEFTDKVTKVTIEDNKTTKAMLNKMKEIDGAIKNYEKTKKAPITIDKIECTVSEQRGTVIKDSKDKEKKTVAIKDDKGAIIGIQLSTKELKVRVEQGSSKVDKEKYISFDKVCINATGEPSVDNNKASNAAQAGGAILDADISSDISSISDVDICE